MPSINFTPPYAGFESPDYSTNISSVDLSGEFTGFTSPYTFALDHSYIDRFNVERSLPSITGASITVSGEVWQALGVSLVQGENRFRIRITDGASTSGSATCKITYVASAQIGIRVDPPTGIDKAQFTDKVVLNWLGNSTVSYNEKQITFTTGSSAVSAPPSSGLSISVVSDVHSPGAAHFDTEKIQASLDNRPMYRDLLRPVGTGSSATQWQFSQIPVTSSGKPTFSLADVAISGASITNAVLLDGGKIQFPSGIATGSATIRASYVYSDLAYDTYIFRVENPGPAGIGDFTVSTVAGKPVSHARINEALTEIASSSWSLSSLWVGGISDLQTTFASSERITLKFRADSVTFDVSSDKGPAGTSGVGTVGITFKTSKIKFTIADSGLYQENDEIVIDVAERAIFVTGTDYILDIPGLKVRVLNTEGCGRYDTALVKVALSSQSSLVSTKPVPGVTEVTLVEKGAVNLDSLTLTSSEINLANRKTFTRDVDYVVISPQDINFPTKVAITEGSTIPFGEVILASFQVTQAIEAIKGYNIYASSEAAGGTSGYTKLNTKLLLSSDSTAIRTVVTSTERTQSVANGVRITSTLERILTLPEYEFEVSRQTLADFTSRASSDLTTYFVLTAVVADAQARSELESVYSFEVVGAPIEITSQVQEFTPRSFDEIVEDYLSSALVSQPLLDVKPTSVTRDIHVDPVANELEKAYLMLDFVNKSQSFLTLLSIDDPENTGQSASGTEYKASLQLVFNLTTQAEVQALIDSQFDKLAANVNVTRKGAEKARGTITLYSLNAPSSTLVISPAAIFTASTSSGPIQFTSLVNMVIEPEEYISYFNSATRRYEIRIPAIAIEAGSLGNVDAGAVTQSNVINFFATNETPFLYGSDQESNRSLAERALVSLMGVDHGTIGGYIKEVVAEPGVLKVNAQAAGDSYMLRDFDPVRKTHLGGKVDLYIQGSRPLVYQDEFGLKFNRATDELVVIKDLSDPAFFKIELARKPDTLIKIEKIEEGGTRRPYSFSDAVMDGRTISLRASGNTTNTTIGMSTGSVVRASYYYAGDYDHYFTHRPVTEIVSVSSQLTGSISTGNFTLYTTDDIFQYGNSSLAEARIILSETGSLNFSALDVTGTYILEGSVPITLDQYSVDLDSIIVSGSKKYTLNSDYRIVTSGSTTQKTELARVPGGQIADGESVSVFYTASETISVQYQVENAVESVQQRLEAKEYATADVLAKKANEVPLDISANIMLQKGVSQSEVDIRIRTALGRYFGNLRLGDSVYQSDIIRVLDGVDGVYSVETPITTLARASNGYVLGEVVPASAITVASQPSQPFNLYKVSASTNGSQLLACLTQDGGGYSDGYKRRAVGVYLNNRYFKGVSSKDLVHQTEQSCYISQTDRALYLSSLTQSDLDSISSTKSAKLIVNYFTYGESGPHDVQIGPFEYATLANLVFSYRSR